MYQKEPMDTLPTSTPANHGADSRSYTIRPASTNDYGAIADLINQTQPNFPATAEGLREADVRRPDYCKAARWVAEADGRIIGIGGYAQYPDWYEAQTAHPYVRVLPAYEGRGIGRTLYALVEEHAIAAGIHVFSSSVGEDKRRAFDFASKAGYSEFSRRIESALDLTTFDPTAFTTVIPHLAEKGIEIRTYTMLEGDPALERAVYDLQMGTEVDVPLPMPFTPPPFEEYRANVLNHPKIPHDGIILAVAGRELVGITTHHQVNDEHINVDYTGVRQDYRGKGIAFALKVAGATYAYHTGAKTLFTTNDPDNPAILALNWRLGFVPRPALVMVKKGLTPN
jgi:mycothiol synthase